MTGAVGIAVDHGAGDLYAAGRVERLVAEALRSAGLGQQAPEAPMRDIVAPGQTVLLKPNWVLHYNQGGHGMECMVTHPEIIRAALRQVLAAAPGRVILGDAPVQSCDFEALVPGAFREELHAMARAAGATLDVVDFRRTILNDGSLASGIREDARPIERFALFDLGKDSLLEEITTAEGRFRVGDYSPTSLARTHGPGRHQYLLCREAFEADVVLSLPKLKTHRKTGLTGALKNLVGLNGNKDYLPHHRYGGSGRGGDCYPGASPAKQLAEWLDDRASLRIGQPGYTALRQAARGARLVAGGSGGRMRGSWSGNDTAWRMVLDLNRILAYGTADGAMRDARQRTIFSLTDAIICGQGDGPLHAEPHVVGAVTFAADPVAVERSHAALLGFDPDRLPLISRAGGAFRWPLEAPGDSVRVVVNGEPTDLDGIARRWARPARPAQGWVGAIEATTSRRT